MDPSNQRYLRESGRVFKSSCPRERENLKAPDSKCQKMFSLLEKREEGEEKDII